MIEFRIATNDVTFKIDTWIGPTKSTNKYLWWLGYWDDVMTDIPTIEEARKHLKGFEDAWHNKYGTFKAVE